MERYSEYKDSGIQWIGEIPSHWKTPTIGRLFDIKAGGDAKPEYYSYEKDEKHPYPVYTNTKDDNSVYAFTSKPFFPAQTITVTGRGDIGRAIYRTIPYDAIIRLLSLCPRIKLNAKFFTYFINVVIPFTSDSAAIGQLSAVQIKPKVVTFPPLPEQDSIVAYLDTQTSRIDSFIANVEREIELLGEAKQKIIADAVTKGLKKDVEMVEANTILSNQIPKHWKIVRNRNLMESHYEPVDDRKDLTLLSLTLNGVIVRDLSEGKGKFPKEFDKYNVVYPNQIIFCLFDIDETPRTVGLCRNYGMITNAYDTLNIKNTVLPEYLEMYYLAVDNIKGLKPYYTGLRKTVQFNRFIQLRIGIPPLDEQKEIVDYISQKTSQIDTLISSLSQQITSLKEYKQRLISDVVTGQINVQHIVNDNCS